MLIACKTNLRQLSLEAKGFNDIYLPLVDLVDVVAVDYHYERGQIFFADASFKEIRTLSLVKQNLSLLSDSNSYITQTIISTEISKPSSIAVDWIANNLYWSDQGRHLIEVARLDGSSRKVLIDLELNQPRSLVVVPNYGVIFWINSEAQQRIERGICF